MIRNELLITELHIYNDIFLFYNLPNNFWVSMLSNYLL